MDPFAVIILGGVGGIVVACLLLGRFYPGNGADVLDWKPTRSPELEAQNEIDDLEQMLEAANSRRRRRGAPELTEESLNASIAAVTAETSRRRDEYQADQEIEQMLEIKNRRRRKKGLAPITAEQYRTELGGGGA
ncbi:hypothetical protein NBH00_12665 [Paraconexibacter antarcticus]|uniref:Uncharacterized protein n=1 Tax=Paraconexibacter antarcticus TaxID=2949664 RepID=A0ABY5DZS1_9ACTN|nr:hypothetical protein [Paraconexibacter antarcticus]UTI67030.1 hypothetical protein NBH00_12665 [Paraconexibacter antarcticus]